MKWFLRLGVGSLLVVSCVTLLIGSLHPLPLQRSFPRHAATQKTAPHLIAGKTLDAYIRKPVGNKQDLFKAWAAKSGVKIGKVVIEQQSHDTVPARLDPGLTDLQRRFRTGATNGVAFYGLQPGLGNAPSSLWVKLPKSSGSTDLRSYCVLMERNEFGDEWWCVVDSIVMQCFMNGPIEWCSRIM